jgi:inner membrane protein
MSDDQDLARPERSPGQKLLFAILVAALLAVPLFAIYLLVYDRSSQSTQAHDSIAQGWGGAQVLSGPVLVIPYAVTSTETVEENGKQVQKTSTTRHQLMLQAQAADLQSDLSPKQRHYSIYDAVVYEAHNVGMSRFALPDDLDRLGVPRAALELDKAELRFGIEDARGLFGAPPVVTLGGQKLPLRPGRGPRETGGSGFYSFLDAGALQRGAMEFHYDYSLRGNESLTLLPGGGDTRWTVKSAWPSPSFKGKFLPEKSNVAETGFSALWRVGNLALGKSLVSIDDDSRQQGEVDTSAAASVNLVTPVDLYDQVNRSVKYGFLFIGFTFTAFLMFDVIGGVRVSPIEYLLVGAGLILFFVMLLAFAEVVGFTPAYGIAAAAIIGLLTAYSAAVLESWRRGGYIAGLLMGLYAALYVLLSLEAYSLLIGSLLLFMALAGVMYLTRGLDWGARRLA